MQIRVQAEFFRTVDGLPDDVQQFLHDHYQDLIVSLTGGSFEERNGTADFETAQAVTTSSAQLIRYVRQGRDDASSARAMLKLA